MEPRLIHLAYAVNHHSHKGQEYGGRPYFLHPIEVAYDLVERLQTEMKDEWFVAALLHDTVEDTDMTVSKIKILFDDKIGEMVDLLTKTPGLSYLENIQRIIDSGNVGAMQVKLSDNRVNRRNGPSLSHAKRYDMSIEMLETALNKNKDGVS